MLLATLFSKIFAERTFLFELQNLISVNFIAFVVIVVVVVAVAFRIVPKGIK